MPTLDAIRAARKDVRAKLDAEGFDIISVGIHDGDDERVLRVGVVRCPGGRVRRSIAGIKVDIYETEMPSLASKRHAEKRRRKAG